jgi:YidC/Oxa1 family membrane protein insertase
MMDRRTLLFVTISVLIILLYQELVLKRYAPPPSQAPTPAETSAGSDSRAPIERQDAPPVQALPEAEAVVPPSGRSIVVETDLYRASFSTAGGRLESFLLKDFRQSNDPSSPPLSLVTPLPESELPLGIELRGSHTWSDAGQLYEADRESLVLHGDQQGTLVFRTRFGGQAITKTFTFRGDQYPFDMRVETPAADGLPRELNAAGPDGQPASVALTLSHARSQEKDQTQTIDGRAALINGALWPPRSAFSGCSTVDVSDTKPLTGEIDWAGFEDHYFLTAAAPVRASAVQFSLVGNAFEALILAPRAAVGPTQLDFTLFFGPKEEGALERAGHGFEKSLNLGLLEPISLFLLRILDFSHRVTGNYGIDIILLTILVKIAFWPLTRKSFESMRQMQRLQPEMARIREKLKDDPKEMNTQIMELYKRHKVNPLGGCVPMILQIPVFIGLYQLLSSMIELRHAPFGLWIHDLAAPERLSILGFGVPILTILLGATMFLQQKLQPPAGDPAQQRVMMFMPLIFTFMFIGFPAGLTIYWLTNNVLTIAQQWLMLRSMPT